MTYLPAEAKARVDIDSQLEAAGWVVQNRDELNLYAGQGVAIREFTLKEGHGRVDYLLFVDRQAAGVIEAKPAGTTLTEVELQSAKYLTGVPEGLPAVAGVLPFAYESTGAETRFTNGLAPIRKSRRVFTFHQPETLAGWLSEIDTEAPNPTVLGRLQSMPPLIDDYLWPAQGDAIRNLEKSLAKGRRRALIQMATGAGKTFTAANASYRLVKHAKVRRILFLVDRGNLGRQTFKEFQAFTTPDDGRKFTELYNIQNLTSNKLDSVAKVTISTIQRLYSIMRGDVEMSEDVDEMSGEEVEPQRPVEVSYNPGLPPEYFDFVVVDEAHRSIYGVWRQVLEYFDATIIGLTATPSKQTYGFFDGNVVMEYGREQAVADGVNVDFDVYRIRTKITDQGSTVDAGLYAGFRDRETRKVRWDKVDEPIDYTSKDLDRAVVSKGQIRTVVRTFKERLFTEIFPGRSLVPKTLIFAKDDSHADDIVQVVRDEFSMGNDEAVKITYRTIDGKPDQLLAGFRNSYNPRIVVTVDMIATGTDVRPLEIIMFMRNVKSRTYFQQMIGRGGRIINNTDLQQATPDARSKTHFMIVDAVGVSETKMMDSPPLERKPTVPLKRLLANAATGAINDDGISSLASRLARLDRQITRGDREQLEATLGGSLKDLATSLTAAVDPDAVAAAASALAGSEEPDGTHLAQACTQLIDAAIQPIAANPDFRTAWLDLKRSYEQTIDETSQDALLEAGAVHLTPEWAQSYTDSFRQYLEDNRDEIEALRFFYSVPWTERPSFDDLKAIAATIEHTPRHWTPDKLWRAYEALDSSKVHGSEERILTDLVSLIRYALKQSDELIPYSETVDERFAGWLFQQEQQAREFTDEQRRWLEMMKNHLAASLSIGVDDFQYVPFVEHGGLGKAVQLFGGDIAALLDELAQELVA